MKDQQKSQVPDLFEQVRRHDVEKAERLLGRNDVELLEWLVRFVKKADELESLSPHIFETVSQEVDTFARISSAVSRSPDDTMSVNAVAELAIKVRGWLHARAHETTIGIEDPELWRLLHARLILAIVPGEKRRVWIAPWRAAFLATLADIVRAEGSRLKICSASGCDNLFVKKKRALYCSRECSDKERIRRSQQDPRASSQRRHKYYIRQVARKLGVSFETAAEHVRHRPRIAKLSNETAASASDSSV